MVFRMQTFIFNCRSRRLSTIAAVAAGALLAPVIAVGVASPAAAAALTYTPGHVGVADGNIRVDVVQGNRDAIAASAPAGMKISCPTGIGGGYACKDSNGDALAAGVLVSGWTVTRSGGVTAGAFNIPYAVDADLTPGGSIPGATVTQSLAGTEIDSNTFDVPIAKVSAPTITYPANGQKVASVRPMFTGTADKYLDSLILTNADGDQLGSGTVDATTGQWSITPTADLPDGANTVTLTATVNGETAATNRTFTVDANAAPATVTKAAHAGQADGNVRVEALPGNRDSITATAPAGTLIACPTGTGGGYTCKDNNGNTLAAGVFVSGWTFTRTTGIAANAFNIAYSVDADQTPGTSIPGFTFEESLAGTSIGTGTIDLPVASLMEISAPTDGAVAMFNRPPFVGFSYPGAEITLTDENGDVIGRGEATSNEWSVTPDIDLAPGDHVITATAALQGASLSTTVSFKTILPTIAVPAHVGQQDGVVEVAPSDYVTKFLKRFNVAAPAGSSVARPTNLEDSWICVDGAGKEVSSSTFVTGYECTYSGTERTMYQTVQIPYSIDKRQAPGAVIGDLIVSRYTITGSTLLVGNARIPFSPAILNKPIVSTPKNGSLLAESRPAFTGKADQLPGTSLEVTLTDADGNIIGAAPVGDDGTWSFTPTADLPEGKQTVTVTANLNGATSDAATRTFTIDTVAPAEPVVKTPADGSTVTTGKPTFTGTGDAGDTITIRLANGDTICTTTVKADGSWTCTPNTALANGAVTYTVTATDAAGNATTTDPVTFTVNAAVITPPGGGNGGGTGPGAGNGGSAGAGSASGTGVGADGELAFTGANLIGSAIAAMLLLGAGITALVIRRRKSGTTAN
jgi:large repetitive protein